VTQDDKGTRRRAIVTAIVLAVFVVGVYFLTFWRYGHR
jgi:hypothetical protein